MILKNKQSNLNYYVLSKEIVYNEMLLEDIVKQYPNVNYQELYYYLTQHLSINAFQSSDFKHIIKFIFSMDLKLTSVELMLLINSVLMYKGSEKTDLLLKLLDKTSDIDVFSYLSYQYFHKEDTDLYINYLMNRYKETKETVIINVLIQLQMFILQDLRLIEFLYDFVDKRIITNMIFNHMQKRHLKKEEIAMCSFYIDDNYLVYHLSSILSDSTANDKLLTNLLKLTKDKLVNQQVLSSIKDILYDENTKSYVKQTLLKFLSSQVENPTIFQFLKELDISNVVWYGWLNDVLRSYCEGLLPFMADNSHIVEQLFIPLLENYKITNCFRTATEQAKAVEYIQPIMEEKYVSLISRVATETNSKMVMKNSVELLLPYISTRNTDLFSALSKLVKPRYLDLKVTKKIIESLIYSHEYPEAVSILVYFIEKYLQRISIYGSSYHIFKTLFEKHIFSMKNYELMGKIFLENNSYYLSYQLLDYIDKLDKNDIVLNILEKILFEQPKANIRLGSETKIISVLYQERPESLLKSKTYLQKSVTDSERLPHLISTIVSNQDDLDNIKDLLLLNPLQDSFYKQNAVEYLLSMEVVRDDIKEFVINHYFSNALNINRKCDFIQKVHNGQLKKINKNLFSLIIKTAQSKHEEYKRYIEDKIAYYNSKESLNKYIKDVENLLSYFQ